jgi:small subunit ribosomal protein S20
LANIKSQIKRNRQNDKRRLRNRVYRGQARTAIKDARVVIESQDAEAAKKALLEAIRTLDKAAEQGVLHKNNAARRKSRLMKQFNKMEPAQAPVAEAVEETAPAAEETKAASRKRTAKKAEAKAPAARKKAEKE